MAAPKRLAGAVDKVLDQRRPEDVWEDQYAPTDFAVGQRGTGITYLPKYQMAVNLTKGASSGAAFSVENPSPADIYVSALYMELTKVSSFGVSSSGITPGNIDFGIVASSSASGSNLGLGIGTDILGITPVVVGGADKLWKKKGSSSDAWMTGRIKFGASSLAGRLIIEAVPLYST